MALTGVLLAGVRLGTTNGLQLKAHIPRELGGAKIGTMILFLSAEQLYSGIVARLLRWAAQTRGHQVSAPGDG